MIVVAGIAIALAYHAHDELAAAKHFRKVATEITSATGRKEPQERDLLRLHHRARQAAAGHPATLLGGTEARRQLPACGLAWDVGGARTACMFR